MVSLEDAAAVRTSRADRWFNKTEFAGLNNEFDEDIELEQMVDHYQSIAGTSENKKAKNKEGKKLNVQTEVH